jgi:hypothetical protein
MFADLRRCPRMKTALARAWITWVIGVVFFAVGGCGAGAAKLEPLAGCTGAWQPLTQPAPKELMLAPLAFVSGNVVYSTFRSPGVFAQPVAGGAATRLARDFAHWLAADGDAVVYATGTFGSQFLSVSVTGGTPQMLLDASAGRPDVGAALLATMTSTDLVWTEVRQAGVAPWTVWRAPKTGGAPTMLAVVPAVPPMGTEDLGFSAIAVSSDSVVLGSVLGVADAVPLAGGAPRALAVPTAIAQGAGSLGGVDGSGVYWQQLRAGVPSSDDAWDILLSPADGSPAMEFWQGLADHTAPDRILSDGAGGWIVIADQMFDDQQFHTTVWSLAADRHTAKRLACSPDLSVRASITVAPAVAPDAVYLASMGDSWQLIRVAR